MLGQVYLQTETKIRDGEAANKSEVAKLIGITSTDFYNFFAGNRIMKSDKLQIIANYYGLSVDEVKREHNENVARYMKKSQ